MQVLAVGFPAVVGCRDASKTIQNPSPACLCSLLRLSGVRAIHAPAFMARGKSRRNTFGTTSGHLRSGNFDGFRCKRHQQSNLVYFSTCFASRGPRVRVPPRPPTIFFQRNSVELFSAYHLLLRQEVAGSNRLASINLILAAITYYTALLVHYFGAPSGHSRQSCPVGRRASTISLRFLTVGTLCWPTMPELFAQP